MTTTSSITTPSTVPGRYVPAYLELAISIPELGIEVFQGEIAGAPLALAFCGKSSKKSFFLRFRSEAKRDQYVTEWVGRLKAVAERKQAERAEKKSFVHSFKVGDILNCSWGYEQTNQDFYQVVEVKGATIVIRELNQDRKAVGDMAAYVTPVKDDFRGPAITKRPQYGGGDRGYVKMPHGVATLVSEGEKFYATYYG